MSIYKEQFDKLHTSVTAESVIAAANAESHKKKNNKAIAIPVALAAAMSILVVSVGAFVNYYHQRSVDAFVCDSSDNTETPIIDEMSGLTSTNEHFRVTLDKSYFDGENLTCILTVESLDGTEIPNIGITGSHNNDFTAGSTYSLNCWASTRYKWDDVDFTKKRAYEAHITGENLRLLYTPLIGDEGLEGKTYFKFRDVNYIPSDKYIRADNGTYVSEEPESEWNVFYGIRIYTDVKKNVETTELFNEKGNKLIMSEIGYYSDEVNAYPVFSDGIKDPAEQSIVLILNDGTRKTLDKFVSDAQGGMSGCYVLFPETIKLDDYTGIEVNGVRYLKNN